MYQILTKDEKRSTREKYRNTKRGAMMLPRLNRLVVEGLFLIVFTIALLIVGFVTKEMYWWMWTLAIVCLLVGLVFIIGQYIIRTNEYNNYLKNQNELKKKLTKRR